MINKNKAMGHNIMDLIQYISDSVLKSFINKKSCKNCFAFYCIPQKNFNTTFDLSGYGIQASHLFQPPRES